MYWDEAAQLRHSAICVWPKFLAGGRRAEILRIREYLQLLGYTGCVGSVSADSIIEGWRKAGWIELSPNRVELRLKAEGEEQLALWQEEDRLWRSGETGDLELPKRLKGGEPATNLRRIAQVVANRTLDCIHDPYTRAQSLQNLLKLSELGVLLSPRLRLLGGVLPKLDAQTLAAFLVDVNAERQSQWEARSYATPQKPHRRFVVCADGSIITCGLSFNNLNKDEVLEVLPANGKLAEHDRKFFEKKWKLGTTVK